VDPHRAALPLRQERLLLGAVLLVALGARLLRFERVAVLFNDGPVFLAIAERFAAGDVAGALAHPFHPLYPAAIALGHAVLGPLGVSLERAGAVVSALAGTGAVLALFAFTRRAFGPRVALVAAALLAVHAGAIEMSGDVQSEGLYLALFLAALAALWRALDEGRAGSAAAAGALSGLAYLTRPEGLGVAALGAGLAAFGLATGRWPGRRRVGVAATALVAAALVAAPYVAWLSAQEGTLALTRKKSVSWVVGVPGAQGEPGGLATGQPGMEAPKIERSAATDAAAAARRAAADAAGATRRDATPPAADDPRFDALVAPPWTARGAGAALVDLLQTGRRALRAEMVLLLVAGVVSARFAAAGAGPGPRAGFLAAIVGLYGVLLFGLATNVGYVSSRHVLPPLVPLLAYAGLGVLALADRAAGRVSPERAPRRRRAVLAALVGVVAALGLGKALSRLDQRGEVAERRAAEWVRESGGPGTVVAARKRRVAYYAGAPFVQLRPKRPEGFLRYFDDHAVRFVIVNQSDVPEYVGLAPLVGAALHEVQRVEAEGETAVVYAYGAPPAAAAGGP
jgi:4-amino-4-deoxy-L-arabinose transferase-like glycosyltransferase